MKFDKESPRVRELLLTLKVFGKSKMAMISLGILLLFFAIAILAPWISPYDPTETHTSDLFMPPCPKYPLGTDHLGRDNLSRILYGARYSMFASLLVVAVTVIIGMPIGAVSGYFGGKLDEILMRITDVILSFPGITLALLLAYIMGRGIYSAALALSLVGWPSMARIVRGVVLSEKGKDYVIAARIIGKSDFQILFGEIMPNCMYPVIIQAVMMMGTVIISLAGLSFIGVGVQPPEPDWGVIIAEGRQYLLEYPWLSILPGILMITVVLAYNLVGDRLRDALDPRLRGELAAK
jgi:peptide/nickel transport system permease protein|uniref:ABC transporter permease n=1 Tax=Fervidicoccus fontis TaxID=683846 RepID=A0A7J3SLG9_9CREN